jgi:acyl carrier protein
VTSEADNAMNEAKTGEPAKAVKRAMKTAAHKFRLDQRSGGGFEPHLQTPETVLSLTRQFLAELHPGAAWIRPGTLDSSLERDLGLDSLSRVELAARSERALGVSLPEEAPVGFVTLRDLLTAL